MYIPWENARDIRTFVLSMILMANVNNEHMDSLKTSNSSKKFLKAIDFIKCIFRIQEQFEKPWPHVAIIF